MQKYQDKQTLLSHISEIVENLIQDETLFQEKLDNQEMIHLITNLFDDFSHEELEAVSEAELRKRIRSILVLEAVSGTLNDLTPEQIKIFDEAVEGR